MTKITLKELYLENLILVSKAKIPFYEGFTAISGETGSGKSSLLYALKLALGERGDPKKIRNGDFKARVEAHFEVSGPKPSCLEKGGILDDEDDLLIVREIYPNGKTKAYLNQRPVTTQFLKVLGQELVASLNQGSSLLLKDEQEHLPFLDLFAGTGLLALEVKEKQEILRLEKNKLEELKRRSQEKEREKEHLEREREEINLADPEVGEEETLFQEFSLLVSGEERKDLLLKTQKGVEAAFGSLQATSRERGKLLSLDENLKPHLEALREIELGLHEICHTLDRLSSQIEVDSLKLSEVEDRLKLLEKLKRKYGSDIKGYLVSLHEKLASLELIDFQIEEAEKIVKLTELELREMVDELMGKRREAIPFFKKAVEKELSELNFHQVEFEVDLKGVDKASFLMAPNIGERMVAVSQGISGGEMARLLLALVVVTGVQNGKIVLLFDEMDAHIGGTTASRIGQKLHHLGNEQQVLAVTHFPQVAEAAHFHLSIGKKVEEERTFAYFDYLEGADREKERARMAGEEAKRSISP